MQTLTSPIPVLGSNPYQLASQPGAGHLTGSFPIMQLICPPPPPIKFCVAFVFHFSWVLQLSQEKLKTMLMQNVKGQISCIMGNVEVAHN